MQNKLGTSSIIGLHNSSTSSECACRNDASLEHLEFGVEFLACYGAGLKDVEQVGRREVQDLVGEVAYATFFVVLRFALGHDKGEYRIVLIHRLRGFVVGIVVPFLFLVGIGYGGTI